LVEDLLLLKIVILFSKNFTKNNMISNGKKIRLSRIFDQKSHKTVIIPLDDILLSGPEGGLYKVENKIEQITAGDADAITAFYGLFLRHFDLLKETSGILNITASTTRSTHTRKVLVGTVEQAVKLGMDAVAVHVNISSQYESEMLKILADVSQDCERFGMPLLAHMYPRTEGSNGKDNNYYELRDKDQEQYAQLVRHAVRVAVDLGADVIKAPFTGSTESFKTVIESASGVPIVMAGGPKIPSQKILQNAYDAVKAGAAGIYIGRNAFNRDQGKEIVQAFRKVVHEGESVEQAIKLSKLSLDNN
jgi:DhnA family fructose-bisphosphate aldolase class Ia